MMNLWTQISVCGLFLLAAVVSACDDIDKPDDPPGPQVPQLPRPVIQAKENGYIEIISEVCPAGFVRKVMGKINEVRLAHPVPSLVHDANLSSYSLNSARYYALNEIVNGQAYIPPTAPLRYPHKEFVFRKTEFAGNLSDVSYKSGKKLLAEPNEIADFWIHGSNRRSASENYKLYGAEPLEPDAELWDYFTQIVWKNTARFGLACVTSKRVFTPDTNLGIEDGLKVNATKYVLNVVANFDPPGNRECEYRLNVLPPVNSEDEEYQNLVDLAESGELKPTSNCEVRSSFFPGMTRCPPKFETDLVKEFNDMRKKRSLYPLTVDPEISRYSQGYVNWMISQPHQVTGNEPNNQYGGDIVWARVEEEPGEKEALEVPFQKFSGLVKAQAQEYITGDHYHKEPSDEVREKYSDYTRVVWKNSRRIGLGCGLDYLPGQNRTRVMLVLNFDPPGNRHGYFVKNVHAEGGGQNNNLDDPEDDLGGFIGGETTDNNSVEDSDEDYADPDVEN